jgi:hypothetical protein
LQIAPEEDDWDNIETHSYTVEEDTGRLIPLDTSELRITAQKNTNEKNDRKLKCDGLAWSTWALKRFSSIARSLKNTSGIRSCTHSPKGESCSMDYGSDGEVIRLSGFWNFVRTKVRFVSVARGVREQRKI